MEKQVGKHSKLEYCPKSKMGELKLQEWTLTEDEKTVWTLQEGQRRKIL